MSYKVEDYVNDEFFYYYQFYTNCKHSGQPFAGGWTEWPPWAVQLMTEFDTVIENDRLNGERKFLAQIHGYRMV